MPTFKTALVRTLTIWLSVLAVVIGLITVYLVLSLAVQSYNQQMAEPAGHLYVRYNNWSSDTNR